MRDRALLSRQVWRLLRGEELDVTNPRLGEMIDQEARFETSRIVVEGIADKLIEALFPTREDGYWDGEKEIIGQIIEKGLGWDDD